jgi:hypothetical protein
LGIARGDGFDGHVLFNEAQSKTAAQGERPQTFDVNNRHAGIRTRDLTHPNQEVYLNVRMLVNFVAGN